MVWKYGILAAIMWRKHVHRRPGSQREICFDSIVSSANISISYCIWWENTFRRLKFPSQCCVFFFFYQEIEVGLTFQTNEMPLHPFPCLMTITVQPHWKGYKLCNVVVCVLLFFSSTKRIVRRDTLTRVCLNAVDLQLTFIVSNGYDWVQSFTSRNLKIIVSDLYTVWSVLIQFTAIQGPACY